MTAKSFQFVSLPTNGKTQVWSVLNSSTGIRLGTIRWYSGWRRYVFMPESDTMYDALCMTEIVGHIQTEMAKPRAEEEEK